jgi:cytochrome b involved in lipid metabolism
MMQNERRSVVPLTSASHQPPISRIELNKHNRMSDCFVAYQQKVYDITTWLPRHPGTAEAILPYCGTAEEFEQAFIEKHGTSKVKLFMKVGVFIGEFEQKGTLQQ